MLRALILTASVALVIVVGGTPARAQCALPYQLTNEQLGDATQVMADFHAVADCLDVIVPGGSTNAVQYNSGAGTFGGFVPLANGQLLIGSTGGAPRPQTLSGNSGVAIGYGPGSVTISTTNGGLYSGALSATPTSAATGLTNWLNQGSAAVSDSAVGVCVDAPSSGSSNNIVGRYLASPSPPYKVTALIAATRNSNNFNTVGLGWYDGSSKLHLLSYAVNGGGRPYLLVDKWNNTSTNNGTDLTSAANDFAQPIWMQIADDGTNVSFAFSQDGANFVTLFSVAKSSGFLGSGGYSNVVFHVNPQGSRTLGTLMSWTQD